MAELEFPKILVPRLPQNTSNANIESAGKSTFLKKEEYLEPSRTSTMKLFYENSKRLS